MHGPRVLKVIYFHIYLQVLPKPFRASLIGEKLSLNAS